jgi:hypothetical protein
MKLCADNIEKSKHTWKNSAKIHNTKWANLVIKKIINNQWLGNALSKNLEKLASPLFTSKQQECKTHAF